MFRSQIVKFCSRTCKTLYAREQFALSRHKTCLTCGVRYVDTTKRNVGQSCSKRCGHERGVKVRHEKGTYAPTDEQKIARSIAMIEAYSSGRRVTSDKERQVYSETMKRTWTDGKIDVANHWSKTPEGKARISKATKGFIHSAEARKHMSAGAQKRLRTKRETLYTSARGGYRQDLQHYFRSMWEANFARILNLMGRQWTYEPQTFQLEDTLSYTPDFLSDSIFYEIKGQMNERSQRQLVLMKERYPNVIVELVDGAKYDQLRVQYKHLLRPYWEGK